VLAVTFKITATRTKLVARDIIGGQTPGTLTSDRLSIYWGLFDTKQEVGCMAHLRRKFWYCLANFPVESITVLRIIGRLYKIERLYRDASAQERLHSRKLLSHPILTELYQYLHSSKPTAAPQRTTEYLKWGLARQGIRGRILHRLTERDFPGH